MHKNLIEAINKLQDVFNILSIPSDQIKLPQIVMVGTQVKIQNVNFSPKSKLIFKRALENLQFLSQLFIVLSCLVEMTS